jgi:hypothetical protein
MVIIVKKRCQFHADSHIIFCGQLMNHEKIDISKQNNNFSAHSVVVTAFTMH